MLDSDFDFCQCVTTEAEKDEGEFERDDMKVN